MKHFDKKYKQIGIIFVLSVCFCILFYFALFNSEQFFVSMNKSIHLLNPFIYGFFIAYILNPVMDFLEEKIVYPIYKKVHNKSKKEKKSIYRGISVLLTVLFFFLLLYTLIIMVVPQVIESIESIIAKSPDYFMSVNSLVNKKLAENEDLASIFMPYASSVEDWFLNNVLPNLQDTISNVSTHIIGGVYSTIKSFLNFVIGIIIAVFLLSKKELYAAQAKKIAYALLREERANNLINNVRFTNKTFGGFLNGKIIDSFIIGLLTFIVVSICNIPYAVLISVIVGVTNIIPYFGPFLGAIPSVIIVLMVDPRKALWLVIIILVIQQLDGNIIGPKILGDSTGLSSLWVIFAITVFGGLFGVFGMFIGVPVFAVIYASIRTLVNERLRKKQLPDDTLYYMNSDYHSDEEIKNTGKEFKFVKKTFENIYVEGKGKQVKVTIDKSEEKKSSDKSEN